MTRINNWEDSSIYCATIQTPVGPITRIFSFDCDTEEEDVSKQITGLFPGALGVKTLDSWGTAYALKKTAVCPTFSLKDIEKKFNQALQLKNEATSTNFRNLMDEMELYYEDSLFLEDAPHAYSPEAHLYEEIKTARNLALLFENSAITC